MKAAIVEAQGAVGDEIADRARDPDLAGRRGGRHARADGDGDAGDPPSHSFDLAGVGPHPHGQAERLDARRDRLRAADGPGGSIERGHEAVASSVDLVSPEADELAPHAGTSEGRERIKVLERDNRELRRANEILKAPPYRYRFRTDGQTL
jgi:hypothetical protein